MKIYLAATAPGTEGRERALPIPNRLLSYFHIIHEQFECQHIFKHIIKGKRI